MDKERSEKDEKELVNYFLIPLLVFRFHGINSSEKARASLPSLNRHGQGKASA